MDGGHRHRATGAKPARQRDLTRRPDRQGNEGDLSQAEVNGDFLREDELSSIPAPPHLAARQYSARRDRHERTPDPTHKGQATVTQRLHVAEFHTVPHGIACPVSDLFGVRGRALLATRDIPAPWWGHIETAVSLIDELTRHIGALEHELREQGANHPYVALLMTIPGIAWVLGYTIAAEIGDIGRFPSPQQLTGYTGLCPRVYQSGPHDRRGRLSKLGPRYLRWALLEAAIHACRHPVYRDRYQRTKRRLGKQRGAKVAQIDIARRLAAAIWHVLTRGRPFAPAGATTPLTA